MEYDVVIATLNRVQALKMSLPLLAEQTHKPSQIIIVDATDDHESIKKQILEITQSCGLEVTIIRSSKKNLPHQRNLGLELVTAPVVLMPDDDSLMYPNTAELMVKLYEADTEGKIGAVTAQPVETSPRLEKPAAYKKSFFAKLKGRIQSYRNIYELRYFPYPTMGYTRAMIRNSKIPACIDGTNHRIVELIGGYRMSFRTEAIRKAGGFYELLGYGIGYATYEDYEAVLRVMNHGYLLATAQNARIFHNIFPSRRAGGFNYGFSQFANSLLICRRIIPEGHEGWRTVFPYFYYKLFLYRLNCFNQYNREVYKGASTAWKHRKRLLDAPPEKLEDAFRELCDQFIKR